MLSHMIYFEIGNKIIRLRKDQVNKEKLNESSRMSEIHNKSKLIMFTNITNYFVFYLETFRENVGSNCTQIVTNEFEMTQK